MKLVITAPARRDLQEIAEFLEKHYPHISAIVRARLQSAMTQICKWPSIGHEVPERSGVRVIVLAHYPYKIFYARRSRHVEILHVYHSSRMT